MINIINITKSFNGLNAVNNLSFEWKDYSIVSLIGPNGAGKTTLFNIISGFISCFSGKIIFNGKNILNLTPDKIVHEGISRTHQDLRLLTQLTVMENVLLNQLNHIGENPIISCLRTKKFKNNQKEHIEKSLSILETIELIDKANDLSETLSYGQQKLLSIGCCIASDPILLLLDEPLSGLNYKMIDKVLSLLSDISSKKKIFIIEHNIEAIEHISEIFLVMNAGSITAEGPPDIIRKKDILEIFLG